MLTVLKRDDEVALSAICGGPGRLTVAAALFAIAAGSLVLTGWVIGSEPLKRIHPELVAMNPMTACCLIAAGLGMWLHHRNHPELGCGFGVLIVLAALAKLADFVFGAVAARLRSAAGPMWPESERFLSPFP